VLDVLRLSEGMTYKAAVAGLALGGGKAVILADGKENDPQVRSARFRAFGKFVNSLGGRYITAEDVGTKPTDMVNIHEHTQHVVGLPPETFDSGSGDPSPMTAFGVLQGIRAASEEILGTRDLNGIRVSVQGLGKVGWSLAEYLLERLPPNRADVIIMGVAIYEAVMQHFNLPELYVSTRGLRFGALLHNP
jgi:leucine dehydrogenase